MTTDPHRAILMPADAYAPADETLSVRGLIAQLELLDPDLPVFVEHDCGHEIDCSGIGASERVNSATRVQYGNGRAFCEILSRGRGPLEPSTA